MSINLSPLLSTLNLEVNKVSSSKKELHNLTHQKDLLEKLDQEVRQALSVNSTFNWEMDTEKRKLLDDVYDLTLLPNSEKRTYAFVEREQIITFIQQIKTSFEKKAAAVQSQHNLVAEEKQQLLQFYQNILDIIAKLSNISASLCQKI